MPREDRSRYVTQYGYIFLRSKALVVLALQAYDMAHGNVRPFSNQVRFEKDSPLQHPLISPELACLSTKIF